MNRRSLFVSLLVLLFISSYAWGATLHGKSISTIPDLLKEARRNGVTNRAGSNLEISKHSIMRLHNGQLDITHNIGNGNNNLALGKISNYSTAMQQDNGLIAAMAETKFGENKILVASSKTIYYTPPFVKYIFDSE
ncbi:MAG: hypothetical protein IJQ99_03675 [Synergistaceae bacterium]|nr:hypothetical protein [Synergistaceae bacterium]